MINLKQFINDISKEIKEAQTDKSKQGMFKLDEVNLEVSFILNTKIKGSGKFIVVDAGAEVNANQTHKVQIKLKPNEDKSSLVDTKEKPLYGREVVFGNTSLNNKYNIPQVNPTSPFTDFPRFGENDNRKWDFHQNSNNNDFINNFKHDK